jgi:hypothetical protein
VKGGAFAGPVPGVVAPDRFVYLSDLGFDGRGNLYVAQDSTDIGGDISGAQLSCFRPDGTPAWVRQGLLFMDEPDWDRGPDERREGVLFSPLWRFRVDLDEPAGNDWTTAAFTLDRFKYPRDLRGYGRGLDRDGTYVCYVEGQRFLAVAGGAASASPSPSIASSKAARY